VARTQVVFFVNDTTVSKGMVKYVGSLPSESIVDVEGVVTKPEAAVDGCTQKEIEIDVRSCHTPSLLPQSGSHQHSRPSRLSPPTPLSYSGAAREVGSARRPCIWRAR
jgi:hypothetical protein